jgi:hypothetical protein
MRARPAMTGGCASWRPAPCDADRRWPGISFRSLRRPRGADLRGRGKIPHMRLRLHRMLRRLGCRLPVQVWHLGAEELPAEWRELLCELDAEMVGVVSADAGASGLGEHAAAERAARWRPVDRDEAAKRFKAIVKVEWTSFTTKRPSAALQVDLGRVRPNAWEYPSHGRVARATCTRRCR